MDYQEAFNQAVRGLTGQGFLKALQSEENEEGDIAFICGYRADNGIKCAGGHLIPDEYYNEDMEGEKFYTEAFNPLFLESGPLHGISKGWLSGLQRCHDISKSPEDMKTLLRIFAKDESLAWPEDVV
jgi:hypothetical protein